MSKIEITIQKRYFLYVNGLPATVSNFKWIGGRSESGTNEKEVILAYATIVRDRAKVVGFSIKSIKAKQLYVVMFGSCLAGPMYDFGIGPMSGSGKRKLMVPFPDELREFNHGFTEEEAN
jgi:hypothetical protein